jgi:hypothetical protein
MRPLRVGDYVTRVGLPFQAVTGRVVALNGPEAQIMTVWGVIEKTPNTGLFKRGRKKDFTGNTTTYVVEEAQRLIDDPDYIKTYHIGV